MGGKERRGGEEMGEEKKRDKQRLSRPVPRTSFRISSSGGLRVKLKPRLR